MNAIADWPYKRRDPETIHTVQQYIDAHHADVFGEFHRVTCIQEALDANSAAYGCQLADQIAVKLRNARNVRERFTAEVHLRGTL